MPRSYFEHRELPAESPAPAPATAAKPGATPKPMAQRDRPLMDFDKRRATREMSRPIVSRKVSR